MSQSPELHIVHCVDTEGPLEEPITATFERLRDEKGIDLSPSLETLTKLQRKEIDLKGREEEIAGYVAPKRLAYLSLWSDVERMVTSVTNESFRHQYADPHGNPYTFTWLIIDVVGYQDNPRRKPEGFHVVWDAYNRFLENNKFNDALGWHFHTVPVGGHALDYNTCWTNNDYHEQVLVRRLLERNSFPSLFRAGGLIERNDLSYWLEQFIPFDYSSRAQEADKVNGPGSLDDWRHSPLNWKPYHPSYRDYRREGEMKRWVFRCLDIDTPACSLSEAEVEKAFIQVANGEDAVLAYSNHDRRDLKPDIEQAHQLITSVASRFPNVSWRYTNGLDAARKVCKLEPKEAPQFHFKRDENLLYIESDQQLFGVAPYIAIEETGGVFYRDNVTIESDTRWAYRILRPEKIARLGVAGANDYGEVGINQYHFQERKGA